MTIEDSIDYTLNIHDLDYNLGLYFKSYSKEDLKDLLDTMIIHDIKLSDVIENIIDLPTIYELKDIRYYILMN